MAYPINGKVCTITLDGATANKMATMNEWEIEVSADFDTWAEFGDAWKHKSPGMGDWKGTMAGYFDPDDTYQKEVHDLLVAAAPAFTLADARFNLDTSDFYSGTILIVGMRTGASAINGIVPVSCTFEGDATLTFTTS
jgi:hypothetical protein